MTLISQGIVVVAIVTSWSPDSAEEKEQKRRYREEIIRQAKAQDKQKD